MDKLKVVGMGALAYVLGELVASAAKRWLGFSF